MSEDNYCCYNGDYLPPVYGDPHPAKSGYIHNDVIVDSPRELEFRIGSYDYMLVSGRHFIPEKLLSYSGILLGWDNDLTDVYFQNVSINEPTDICIPTSPWYDSITGCILKGWTSRLESKSVSELLDKCSRITYVCLNSIFRPIGEFSENDYVYCCSGMMGSASICHKQTHNDNSAVAGLIKLGIISTSKPVSHRLYIPSVIV